MHKINKLVSKYHNVYNCETNLQLSTCNQLVRWHTSPTGHPDDKDHQRKSLIAFTDDDEVRETVEFPHARKHFFLVTVFLVSWTNGGLVSTDKVIIYWQLRICCTIMSRIIVAYRYVYLAPSCVFAKPTRSVYLRK